MSESKREVAKRYEAVDSAVVVGTWDAARFTLAQVKIFRDEYFPGLPLQTVTTWEISEPTS